MSDDRPRDGGQLPGAGDPRADQPASPGGDPDPEAEPPGITFDVSRAWCAFHALPWKASWPAAGAVLALLELFNRLTANDKVVAECDGELAKLDIWMRERYPLCCWFVRNDPEALAAAYAKAGVAPPAYQG